MRLGGFVYTDDQLGLGRLIAVNQRAAQVEYMHSLSRKETRTVPASSVRPALLPAQTRAYLRNGTRWHIGRVVHGHRDKDGATYQIRFPNDQSAALDETRFEVRCLAPVSDPLDSFIAAGFETQFVHDRRAQILCQAVEGRAKARGLAGLLSASVELYPHQLGVVRRVAEDPLQRYVLADEVGLGKTIEAGAIIRQTLLDDQTAGALVLAPEHLVGQWQAELTTRFHIDDFGERVRLKPHASLSSRTVSPDLLVVDEVHLLVDPSANGSYHDLARVSHAAPRVLLLSATPVLSNAGATLRLFHLVDPAAYRLDDVSGFERVVERRLEIGRVMLLLASDPSAYIAGRAARMARQVLADDGQAIELADVLEQAAIAEDRGEVQLARAQLREYLADTYRLSKRLLRSRRRDLASRGYLTRDGEVSVEAIDDALLDTVEALEDWRQSCASHLYLSSMAETPDDTVIEPYLQRYRSLLDAAAVGAAALRDEATRQAAALVDGSSFADDGELLRRIHRLAVEAVRQPDAECEFIRYALRAMKDRPGEPAKLVAFTSSPDLARAVASNLPAYVGYDCTFVVTADLTPDIAARRIAEFRQLRRPGVLLLDRAGEHGLNLQFADSVIHFDLPTSLMRLEQRVGRLDRIGRGSRPIRQRVVVPSEDEASPWMAWFEALSRGFEVFTASVSDLQLVAPDLERLVLARLLLTGAVSAEDIVLSKERVAEERRRLDEQYALDAVELSDDQADVNPEAATSVDEADVVLAKAVSGWWEETIKLVRDLPERNVVRLSWDSGVLLPERPWRGRIEPCLDRRLTYERTAATGDLGLRLVRTGSPLVDQTQPLLRYDDRGSAFATWRYVPGLAKTDEEWAVLKLLYVVEADVAGELGRRADKVDSALQRRVDRVAPPWIETRYLDTELRPVDRPDLLAALLKPYDKSHDRNLGSRLEALWERIPEDRFADFFQDAITRATEALVSDPEYQDRRSQLLERAEQRAQLAQTKIERRRGALHRLGLAKSSPLEESSHIDRELALARSLRPRLDSVGIFILSGREGP